MRHPVEVRSKFIYIWMGTLKPFHSRYKDSDIGDNKKIETVTRSTFVTDPRQTNVHQNIDSQKNAVKNNQNLKKRKTEKKSRRHHDSGLVSSIKKIAFLKCKLDYRVGDNFLEFIGCYCKKLRFAKDRISILNI